MATSKCFSIKNSICNKKEQNPDIKIRTFSKLITKFEKIEYKKAVKWKMKRELLGRKVGWKDETETAMMRRSEEQSKKLCWFTEQAMMFVLWCCW